MFANMPRDVQAKKVAPDASNIKGDGYQIHPHYNIPVKGNQAMSQRKEKQYRALLKHMQALQATMETLRMETNEEATLTRREVRRHASRLRQRSNPWKPLAITTTTALWIATILFAFATTDGQAVDSTSPTLVVHPVATEPYNPLDDMTQIADCTITYYCICEDCCGKTPDHPYYGITASGRRAIANHSVAVDPSVIPLGATVAIELDGEVRYYSADDTGPGVKGNHVDICVDSHEEALELGRGTATVYFKDFKGD